MTTATRQEHDLLGYRDVPADAYYGIQTLRAFENFTVSGVRLNQFSTFIRAFATVKKAAAIANNKVGVLNDTVKDAIAAIGDFRNRSPERPLPPKVDTLPESLGSTSCS